MVLRGGAQSAKLTAERRFKHPDGPRVRVSTAAGREGLNLQVARVLLNFDLPWNPMDVEQRIGRIHRYGQRDTAQVYNLVLSDTIEGRIFLLLNDKLMEIAKALGKVDEQGNVAEDLRSQILGQLSERLAYDQLYRDALQDPSLKRTEQEVEAALSNASEARRVVFELFQDLDGFSLDEYRALEDTSEGFAKIVDFLGQAMAKRGMTLRKEDGEYVLADQSGATTRRMTIDRDKARNSDNVDMLGLDHPMVVAEIERWKKVDAEHLGCCVRSPHGQEGIAGWWYVEGRGKQGEHVAYMQCLAFGPDGTRLPVVERTAEALLAAEPAKSPATSEYWQVAVSEWMVSAVRRSMEMRGIADDAGGFMTRLIGLIGFCQPQHPSVS